MKSVRTSWWSLVVNGKGFKQVSTNISRFNKETLGTMLQGFR